MEVIIISYLKKIISGLIGRSNDVNRNHFKSILENKDYGAEISEDIIEKTCLKLTQFCQDHDIQEDKLWEKFIDNEFRQYDAFFFDDGKKRLDRVSWHEDEPGYMKSMLVGFANLLKYNLTEVIFSKLESPESPQVLMDFFDGLWTQFVQYNDTFNEKRERIKKKEYDRNLSYIKTDTKFIPQVLDELESKQYLAPLDSITMTRVEFEQRDKNELLRSLIARIEEQGSLKYFSYYVVIQTEDKKTLKFYVFCNSHIPRDDKLKHICSIYKRDIKCAVNDEKRFEAIVRFVKALAIAHLFPDGNNRLTIMGLFNVLCSQNGIPMPHRCDPINFVGFKSIETLRDELKMSHYLKLLDKGESLFKKKNYKAALLLYNEVLQMPICEEREKELVESMINLCKIEIKKIFDSEIKEINRLRTNESNEDGVIASKFKEMCQYNLPEPHYNYAIWLSLKLRFLEAKQQYEIAIKLLEKNNNDQDFLKTIREELKKIDNTLYYLCLLEEGTKAVHTKNIDLAIKKYESAWQLFPNVRETQVLLYDSLWKKVDFLKQPIPVHCNQCSGTTAIDQTFKKLLTFNYFCVDIYKEYEQLVLLQPVLLQPESDFYKKYRPLFIELQINLNSILQEDFELKVKENNQLKAIILSK